MLNLICRRNKIWIWLLAMSVVFIFFIAILLKTSKLQAIGLNPEKYMNDDRPKLYSHDRKMPLIFIGGIPRSGTTLMRSMLDAHPDVRCGQETHILPMIVSVFSRILNSAMQRKRFEEAGITREIMNGALAQFFLEIIVKHGEPAPRLCNKDPFLLLNGTFIHTLFPNSKFLFMVRDGRATVHSIISRKVGVQGFNVTNYRQSLQTWNKLVWAIDDQCKKLGRDRCMMVYYEQLVLHASDWMHKILKFLDLPWTDAVLHHEEFINKINGVKLSKMEFSSDQVIKPVNLEGLSKWVGKIPDDVVRDMAKIAPMLLNLGYDPKAYPPEYGKPDGWVLNNTIQVMEHQEVFDKKAKELSLVKPTIFFYQDNNRNISKV